MRRQYVAVMAQENLLRASALRQGVPGLARTAINAPLVGHRVADGLPRIHVWENPLVFDHGRSVYDSPYTEGTASVIPDTASFRVMATWTAGSPRSCLSEAAHRSADASQQRSTLKTETSN